MLTVEQDMQCKRKFKYRLEGSNTSTKQSLVGTIAEFWINCKFRKPIRA